MFFLVFCMLLAHVVAYAACPTGTKTYTSCKPGYYLSGGDCILCPGSGTSPDRNTGDIRSCYLPAGRYTDTTGTYVTNDNCNYVVQQ